MATLNNVLDITSNCTFYSDQSWAHYMYKYPYKLKEYHIFQSMIYKSNPLDNLVIEKLVVFYLIVNYQTKKRPKGLFGYIQFY
jgi:hypothetical protein